MNEKDLQARARELRSQGMGFGSIGKELGIPKSKAYKLARDVEASPGGDEAGFLDVIDRFQQVLKDYGVKDVQRVSEYVASQAADIFSDPQALRRALADQMISPAKALSLTKMWASAEGLNIPQEMIVEAVGETGARPDRWSLIGTTPTRDPDGPYTWLQCLQLLQANHQPGGDYEGVKELRQDIASVRNELQEERTKTLTGQIATMAEKVNSLNERLDRGLTGRTEMDILHEVAAGGLGELQGLRGDIKGWFAQSQVLPLPKSSEERTERTANLRQAVTTDQEIDEIGRRLFFRGDRGEGTPKAETQVRERKSEPPPGNRAPECYVPRQGGPPGCANADPEKGNMKYACRACTYKDVSIVVD